jgi:hypothetical protein
MLKLNGVTDFYQIQGAPRVAANYGEGSFGNCDYNENDACASTGGSTGSSGSGSNGGLADTGTAVALIFAVACLIIFVSLLIRFWRRPAPLQPVPEEVPVEADEPLTSDAQKS